MTTESPRRSTTIVKRSLNIAGHSTSISLEDAFWALLKRHATATGRSVPTIVSAIDADRGDANLSSAIRVYLLEAVAGPTTAQ